MSTNKIFRAGLFATMGVASIAVVSSANAGPSRYGSVYDYESGQNCSQPCAPAQATPTPAASTRYGAPATQVYAPAAPVYTPAPQHAPVYAPPAPPYAYQMSQMSVNCPHGTTAQSNGTCMQSSSVTLPGTYRSSAPPPPPPPVQSSEPINCPSGTKAQPDGTCLQGSTYSSVTLPGTYNYSAQPSYDAAPVNCPAGTTAQPDGTCMQGGSGSTYSGSSVEIYQGDAGSTSGYSNDGGYGSTDYLPIRK